MVIVACLSEVLQQVTKIFIGECRASRTSTSRSMFRPRDRTSAGSGSARIPARLAPSKLILISSSPAAIKPRARGFVQQRAVGEYLHRGDAAALRVADAVFQAIVQERLAEVVQVDFAAAPGDAFVDDLREQRARPSAGWAAAFARCRQMVQVELQALVVSMRTSGGSRPAIRSMVPPTSRHTACDDNFRMVVHERLLPGGFVSSAQTAGWSEASLSRIPASTRRSPPRHDPIDSLGDPCRRGLVPRRRPRRAWPAAGGFADRRRRNSDRPQEAGSLKARNRPMTVRSCSCRSCWLLREICVSRMWTMRPRCGSPISTALR